MTRTAGGSEHFLSRARCQGDHPDEAYGWSREKEMVLRLANLEGGHFEAFKFQSSSVHLSTLMTFPPTIEPPGLREMGK